MEAHSNVAEHDRFTVRHALDPDVWSEPALEDRPAWLGAQVGVAAGPRVVAVRMGDQRPIGRPPRVDVEAAAGTQETGGAFDEHGAVRSRS